MLGFRVKNSGFRIQFLGLGFKALRAYKFPQNQAPFWGASYERDQ